MVIITTPSNDIQLNEVTADADMHSFSCPFSVQTAPSIHTIQSFPPHVQKGRISVGRKPKSLFPPRDFHLLIDFELFTTTHATTTLLSRVAITSFLHHASRVFNIVGTANCSRELLRLDVDECIRDNTQTPNTCIDARATLRGP